MKYLNFVTLVIFTWFVLLTGIATAAPTQLSSNRFSRDSGSLSHLLTVSIAKEPIYLILVEKNLQRLRVLEYDGDLKVVADYPSATGENFGIKEVSGDSKTPEGIYFITTIFKDDEITIFGDKAFHLDYPNFFDREEGRNGDGIYIHGTNKQLELNSTNGCVTLSNSDLDDLEKYLSQAITPVVIVPEMNDLKTNTGLLIENDFKLAKSLLLNDGIKPENIEYNYLYLISFGNQTVAVSDFIYRPFNLSLMRGASRVYLQPDSAQGWIAAKRIWRASPLQIFPDTPIKVVARPLETDELLLVEQTPEQTAALVAALNTEVEPEKNIAAAPKANPSPQVIARAAPEVKERVPAGKTPVADKAKPARPQTPVARSSQTPLPGIDTGEKIAQQQKIAIKIPDFQKERQEILDFVENWRQAWTSKEIEPYISFYAESFRSGDKDLEQWRAHKANLNKSYEYISVDISDIMVNWTAEGATVSFRQQYRSDLYSATGNKTLYLVHNELGWKIKREIYSRI